MDTKSQPQANDGLALLRSAHASGWSTVRIERALAAAVALTMSREIHLDYSTWSEVTKSICDHFRGMPAK